MTQHETGLVAATAARVYEEFFVPALFGQWPQRLLDDVGVQPGDRVADVGCGTGVLARAAAARVGPEGRVWGVDPNPAMLTVAGETSRDIEWVDGLAESLPLGDGSCDVVGSQFVLMFCTDRRQAIAEMARVLRPGGRLVLATWAELSESPGYAAMERVLAEVCGEAAAESLRAPFVLGDPGHLADQVRGALSDVRVRRHSGTARFASIEDWVHTEIRGWTLADVIDDATYDELLGLARGRLTQFTDAQGRVAFPAPALIATARR